MKNIILNTDSYKTSHWVQYPQGSEVVYSYAGPRGGQHQEIMVAGLQMAIKNYLDVTVSKHMVQRAKKIITAHGMPFNEEGWMYIVEKHGGKLPVKVKALKEGTIIRPGQIAMTIENTDPAVYWLTSYLETMLLRAMWYASTVATTSWRIKRVIKDYMELTGADMSGLPFKLHDFGSRGTSSLESSEIGGVAHLFNFMGTDNIVSLVAAMDYYDSDMPGFSIPAAEHSTMTSWGRENEKDAYKNMIDSHDDNYKMIAVVSDSYDLDHAVDVIWGQELKDKIIKSGKTVVIRPDSGEPRIIVGRTLEILAARFGYTINEKGYKVLNYVRVIQGDGINEASIIQILDEMVRLGYSIDNIAFGMGGALLQEMSRDTQQWAMKCSAIRVNGEWRDVYKAPATDTTKTSLKGLVTMGVDSDNNMFVSDTRYMPEEFTDAMDTVFEDGVVTRTQTLTEIRELAEQSL